MPMPNVKNAGVIADLGLGIGDGDVLQAQQSELSDELKRKKQLEQQTAQPSPLTGVAADLGFGFGGPTR